MSITLARFTVRGSGEHVITHDTQSDCRDVIDSVGAKLLTFTSNLEIRDYLGRYAGRLFVRDERWHLQKSSGEVVTTETRCDNYNHMKLVRAECEAAKILLD